MTRKSLITLLAGSLLAAAVWLTPDGSIANEDPIPHGQDRMPGAPLTPAEAVKKMTLPEGFTAEVVASEPDIVNPVAMTFDERGRIWLTESLEYPRASAGPGRDRIKVLESTRGDGKYDKITVFADGLNIPSGIAVGYGGVWVDNSPDILFLQDTHGTGKADRREVVVTGFGRYDTHEVPNSLNWGPDGYLYGLNGVFNPAHIQHHGRDFDFTCAMYRIDPKTRDFQMFAEGTSNPWGMAWDPEGSVFISACVVDHLWHLAETGYYLRQGGPYPPHTWILPSIVNHHHQKAAYCGLCYFDSDAYPAKYRDKLYMGNIHGGCINVDAIQKSGSTYTSKPCPDFLTANDAWFMPVSQKVGPDGCLYILDWYDRYHCYQDAQRDPGGIDRLRGRLYRIRYKNTPPAGRFDLGKESNDQLIRRLFSPNIYFRDQAQRLLRERNRGEARRTLQQLVLNERARHKARMHALWALVGAEALKPSLHRKLLEHNDPTFRAWGVRAAGNYRRIDADLRQRIEALAADRSPEVLLQVAIAARKIEGLDALPVLARVLESCGHDPLIPAIVWQNLHPLLDSEGDRFMDCLTRSGLRKSPALPVFLPYLIDYALSSPSAEPTAVGRLVAMLTNQGSDVELGQRCLDTLTRRIESGELHGARLSALRAPLAALVDRLLSERKVSPLFLDAAFLATVLHERRGMQIAEECLASPEQPAGRRIQALGALVMVRDDRLLRQVRNILHDQQHNSEGFRARVLAALTAWDNPRLAAIVIAAYPKVETDLQPRAIDLLTQRPAWSKFLLFEISNGRIPANALNVNQVRQLLSSRDPDLVKEVRAKWGTLRDGRNPEREQVVANMRGFLRDHHGDAAAGRRVFKNLCGQCHRIYGEGQDVGPDLTNNGRGSFDQLLSNVFDPSLVIGAGYQATTVTTTTGQLVTGLLVENNRERVVLKEQGGKLETFPRRNIDDMSVSNVSLMPEGLEKQLKPQEIADLFAFLTLDRPPEDKRGRKIPGTP